MEVGREKQALELDEAKFESQSLLLTICITLGKLFHAVRINIMLYRLSMNITPISISGHWNLPQWLYVVLYFFNELVCV